MADLQVPSLAALGNISRTFAELRVQVRNHVLATSEAERASVRSTFERDEAELGRLLDHYERNLISDDRDRRLLNDYRNRYREWLDRVKQVMSLSAAGRREEASEVLRGPALQDLGERLSSASAEWIRLNEDLAHSASQTVVDSITAARWRILAANVAAILLDRPARVSHLSADREADSGPRRIGQSDCRGGIRQGGSIHARDRRNRRPGALGRRPQTGRRGDGRTALGEGERVARDGRAAGRRLAGGVRPAPPVGPRADARRRRCRILRARRAATPSCGASRPTAWRMFPTSRRSSGSARASWVNARRNGERSRWRISRLTTCALPPVSARRRPCRRRPCRRYPPIRCSASSKWHPSGRSPRGSRPCSTNCCPSSP